MKRSQKLCPLVQLLPAAAVAAVLVVTLPRTEPVLAAVPERLTAASEAVQEQEEPEPEEEILPGLPYADGVYVGSSRGYGGQVKVQVTMKGGAITDLQILDASHETAAFLKRASRLLSMVLNSQTWEVDAVSEATYTSRGILGAIRNALTGEEVINPEPPKQEQPAPLVEEEFTEPSAYRDGVYTASADGFGGPITLQVTISDGVIADIHIVSAEEETRSYFSRARQVVSTILATGSPEVDSVAGATYSSTGIINAVKLALAKAANDTAAPAQEVPEQPVEESAGSEPEPLPSVQYADGTYIGTASTAAGEQVTVSVTVTGGSVSDVTVLPTEEEQTPSFMAWASDKLSELFFGQEEASSSSQYSEEALEAAVQDALTQAAATPEAPEEPAASAPEQPASQETVPAPETDADAASESETLEEQPEQEETQP